MKKQFSKAIVRRPGANFADGLTSVELGKPDFKKALEQHDGYCQALESCGVEVTVLPAESEFPDGCFVEDTAVILDGVAVITAPGHSSRRAETESIAKVLKDHLPLQFFNGEGNLDGGDVMRAGDVFYIGLTERTNRVGAMQLAKYIEANGLKATFIPVDTVLHLKTVMTFLDEGVLIVREDFAGAAELKPLERRVVVPLEEGYASNCLSVNGKVLLTAGFPATRKAVEAAGLEIISLNMSEYRKMDGALTCLSLLLN